MLQFVSENLDKLNIMAAQSATTKVEMILEEQLFLADRPRHMIWIEKKTKKKKYEYIRRSLSLNQRIIPGTKVLSKPCKTSYKL